MLVETGELPLIITLLTVMVVAVNESTSAVLLESQSLYVESIKFSKSVPVGNLPVAKEEIKLAFDTCILLFINYCGGTSVPAAGAGVGAAPAAGGVISSPPLTSPPASGATSPKPGGVGPNPGGVVA